MFIKTWVYVICWFLTDKCNWSANYNINGQNVQQQINQINKYMNELITH